MKKKVSIIICLGFLTLLSHETLLATTPVVEEAFSEKVNLALRQAGHQLLTQAGDEQTTIQPVQKTGPDEFTLKLERSFNYDALPNALNQAFLSFGIDRDYRVAIKDCEEGIIILGYNYLAFISGEVACIGRDQWTDCSNIIITFEAPVEPLKEKQSFLIPFIGLGLFGLIGFAFFRRRVKPKNDPSSSTASEHIIALGNFSFDSQNYKLELGGQQQTLTFRENKLLYTFATNANEVLKRDTLIAEVWGDEGVIVGRSLDVFISRLRKLLKADDSVSIKNIHGVGYRLEVEGAPANK